MEDIPPGSSTSGDHSTFVPDPYMMTVNGKLYSSGDYSTFVLYGYPCGVRHAFQFAEQ